MKNVDLWLDMVEKIPRVQQGKSQLSVNPTFRGLTPTGRSPPCKASAAGEATEAGNLK